MRNLPESLAGQSMGELFGSELRRYRLAAELSQDELGKRCNYTGAFIGMVENAKRTPPLDLAEHADKILDARGALPEIWKRVNQEPHPRWYQPYVGHEAEAESILEFEPTVIAGLLQTKAYAYEILSAGRPEATPEEINHDVAARIRRQDVLSRTPSPRFWLIQHEASLYCKVGGSPVMYEALGAVLAAAESPRITIQVLPFNVGAHASIGGMLTLLGHHPQIAYCEGHAAGRLITDPEEFAECAHAFDLLQSVALPPAASLDLIRRVMQEYEP